MGFTDLELGRGFRTDQFCFFQMWPVVYCQAALPSKPGQQHPNLLLNMSHTSSQALPGEAVSLARTMLWPVLTNQQDRRASFYSGLTSWHHLIYRYKDGS